MTTILAPVAPVSTLTTVSRAVSTTRTVAAIRPADVVTDTLTTQTTATAYTDKVLCPVNLVVTIAVVPTSVIHATCPYPEYRIDVLYA
jgi:hypothetical protein